jgi:hypothetical protein
MMSRTVPNCQVPKPHCITSCYLSELCTTHAVRQFYQDGAEWVSATASAVSTFMCSFFSLEISISDVDVMNMLLRVAGSCKIP